MKLVIDSNIVIALLLKLSYSDDAHRHMSNWSEQNCILLAPMLCSYEVTSVIRRHIFNDLKSLQDVKSLLDHFDRLAIEMIPPTATLHHSAIEWAGKIGQAKAYDANYLALAEQEKAHFWSGDKRLVNSTHQLNLDWVHWIGES